MRYLWDDTNSYFQFGPSRRWKRAGLKLFAPYLRRFDLASAETVDHFIANSETVRGRIRRIYQRDATVIHPPVDTEFFQPPSWSWHGGLLSRRVFARTLQANRAGSQGLRTAWPATLDRWQRVSAGGHLSEPPLRTSAFSGTSPMANCRNLYQNCRAVVFPGIEDFGMVPVEAQACGKPVVCYGKGGATESVIDGETGVYFHSQEPEALIQAVEKLDRTRWDTGLVRKSSLRFSVSRFHDRMEAFLKSRLSLNLPSRSNAEKRRAASR